MSVIITNKTAIEMWQGLVHNACETCQQPLEEELESYLVFMLMRHLQDSSLASKPMAPDYLKGMQTQGQSGIQQLQLVGDQCLLCSGLYPYRSRRRLVKAQYYIDIGRSAYLQMASRAKRSSIQLYENLSRYFVEMMDILQALRYSANPELLDSLLLMENWQDNHSRYARKLLQKRYGDINLHLHPSKNIKQ